MITCHSRYLLQWHRSSLRFDTSVLQLLSELYLFLGVKFVTFLTVWIIKLQYVNVKETWKLSDGPSSKPFENLHEPYYTQYMKIEMKMSSSYSYGEYLHLLYTILLMHTVLYFQNSIFLRFIFEEVIYLCDCLITLFQQ